MFDPIEVAQYQAKEIDKDIEEIETLIEDSKRIGWNFLVEPFEKCIAHLQKEQQELTHAPPTNG